MDLEMVDRFHELAYRIECGAAIVATVQDALKTTAYDLESYALALCMAHDSLTATAEELHSAVEPVKGEDTL